MDVEHQTLHLQDPPVDVTQDVLPMPPPPKDAQLNLLLKELQPKEAQSLGSSSNSKEPPKMPPIKFLKAPLVLLPRWWLPAYPLELPDDLPHPPPDTLEKRNVSKILVKPPLLPPEHSVT